MENTFRVEFYPTDKDIEDVWKDALIVFDTCSILNLYRYSESTRKQYLSVMKQVKDRLWLPYQVGQEFFKNRLTTIISIGLSYDEIKRKLDDQFNEVKKSINDKFKFHEDDIKSLIDEIEKGFAKIKDAVDESKKSRIPFTTKDDPVLDEIKNIYKNKVGGNYTLAEIDKISKEGEERYKNEIPPGYCDRNKDDVKKNKFGDLILWKQIMDKSLSDKKNVIFITDDAKEDWWLKVHGRTISPRKELYSEFLSETSQRVLIYRPDAFMKHAKDKFKSRLDDSTINEIINMSTIHINRPYLSNYEKLLNKYKISPNFRDPEFTDTYIMTLLESIKEDEDDELVKHYLTDYTRLDNKNEKKKLEKRIHDLMFMKEITDKLNSIKINLKKNIQDNSEIDDSELNNPESGDSVDDDCTDDDSKKD